MASYRYAQDEAEEQPLGELFSELSGNVQTLLRKEVELAKLEATEQAKRAGKAGALFAVTAVFGFIGLLLLFFAASWGLAAVIPDGLAFLVVGIVTLAVAGALGMSAKKKAAAISPPKQTVQTIKQDVQVAQTSLKRGLQADAPSGKGT